MKRRRLLLALLLLPLLLLLDACGKKITFHRPAVVVLGFDGMDPNLVARYMAEGRMPHFKKLAEEGGHCRFGTSLPPESPVAWANFATGLDPGGHGLFDFVQRKITPRGIGLYLSEADTVPPADFLPLPGYRIPLKPGGMRNLVKGTFFWKRLEEAGVPCTIVRIPDNFPPIDVGARTFSGMGTPDLQGTEGIFSYYTEKMPENRKDFEGKADLHLVKVRDGVARSVLTGPEDTYRKPPSPGLRSPSATVPVTFYVDRPRKVVRVDVGDETRILKKGEWSDWVPVSFSLIPHLASAAGIVRLFVKNVDPLEVYASPVNIDPRDPVQQVSTPAGAAEELAAKIGPYYTQGMAEETNGARTKVLDTGEFIHQAEIVLGERRKMLTVELKRFVKQGGFLFFYFSTTDQCCHILWRLIDKKHPDYSAAEVAKYGDPIARIYGQMDDALGQVMATVPEGTRIVVMSDHGFAPLRRKLSLNTWLLQNGFLRLEYPDRQGELNDYRNVDWLQTRAYNVGFCDIYLNLMGRESTGIVSPGADAEKVKREIIEGLESLVDPKNGKHVVTKVYRREDVYHGDQVKNAPDLIVGFARTYGNMDDSVLGAVPKRMLEDNMDPWSGSHLMDPSHVPGILFTNAKITLAHPDLKDLTVTLLSEFGVKAPDLPGRKIWAR